MFSIKILDFNNKKLLTNGRNCDIIILVVKRGCSSMAESQPSKLVVWVRFPSPAPTECLGTHTRIGVSSFIGL